MNYENPFIYLMLVSAGLSVFVYIRMVVYLQQNGVQIGLFSFRLMLPYISQYRKLYQDKESSSVNLFRYWLVTINGALVFCVLYLLTR